MQKNTKKNGACAPPGPKAKKLFWGVFAGPESPGAVPSGVTLGQTKPSPQSLSVRTFSEKSTRAEPGKDPTWINMMKTQRKIWHFRHIPNGEQRVIQNGKQYWVSNVHTMAEHRYTDGLEREKTLHIPDGNNLVDGHEGWVLLPVLLGTKNKFPNVLKRRPESNFRIQSSQHSTGGDRCF